MTNMKTFNGKIASAVFGAILVGIGFIFLIGNFFPSLSIDMLWPFFMLVPVGILIPIWFLDRRKNAGVLIPITILSFYACYFLWLNFTSWENVEYTWPNFLIGPGLSFLAVYFANKRWEFTIPAFILLLLGAIFYSELMDDTIIIALALIAVGLFLILRFLFANKDNQVSEIK